jgi:hypothetical protein
MTAIQQRKESTSNIYVDEEDVLGYKIWVAELELLVSQRKQGGVSGKVDFGACYALLQKLHVTIDGTSVDEIKEYQRRCEDALVDILLKGCPPPVRAHICLKDENHMSINRRDTTLVDSTVDMLIS